MNSSTPSHKCCSTRILLAEEHVMLREGLRVLLAGQEEFHVVGEAATSQEVLFLVEQEKPDMIVMDLMLRDGDSLSLIALLCSATPSIKIILLTDTADEEKLRRAITAGARGIVSKRESSQVLLKAIRCVQADELWVERSMLAQVMQDLIRQNEINTSLSLSGSTGTASDTLSPILPLGAATRTTGAEAPLREVKVSLQQVTPRERDIILLIGRGLSNKQIAAQLVLSERTVHSHLSSIFQKLEVSTRLELALVAYRCGWLGPSS